MKFYNFININKKFFVHLTGWAIFIAYEMTLVAIVENASGQHSPLWLFAASYAINIGLFYFHALFVLNYCFSGAHRKIVLLLLMIGLELSVYLFLTSLLQTGTARKKNFLVFTFINEVVFARQIWRGVYFLIFSTAFWVIQRSFERVKRIKELEKRGLIEEKERQHLELKLVSAENAFLQAQINPHFLFNTLNFIHSEIQEVSDKASDAIITLSDMMRYSLIENKMDGKLELEKEIQQIENLIKINQYRFNNKLCFKFNTAGQFENCRVVPLILVPFAENVFKYADLTDDANPAIVNVHVWEGVMEFSTFNKKRKTVSFSSPGIGIKNVQTRLKSYYPERFFLEIKGDDGYFFVYLKIIL
jgi:two-component system, LytTR family, sensor kinase